MTRTIVRLSMVAATLALAFACSEDEGNGGTGGTGGKGGTGGSKSTGGSSGSGGSSTTGGTGGSGFDGGDPYECVAKLTENPRDPGGTGTSGSSCCNGLGECALASSVTGPAATSYGHDTCKASTGSDNLVCAPTAGSLADASVAGVFTVCTAKLGTSITLEGRCLPKCFIMGNPQVAQLSGEGCPGPDAGAGEQVCAPCYNPIDGTETGACTQKAGDAPTEPAPTPFKECGAVDGGPAGAGGGLCVPTDLATASGNPAAANLQQLDCATGEVCAPALKVTDINACFAKCEAATGTFGPEFGPGACVPYYLIASDPALAIGLSVLQQATCATGELCAPCLNPISTPTPGAATGACL